MEPKKESVELTFEELRILKTALVTYELELTRKNLMNFIDPCDDPEYESATRLWNRLASASIKLLED